MMDWMQNGMARVQFRFNKQREQGSRELLSAAAVVRSSWEGSTGV